MFRQAKRANSADDGVPKPADFFALCNGVGRRSFRTLERKFPIIKHSQPALGSESSAAVRLEVHRRCREFLRISPCT